MKKYWKCTAIIIVIMFSIGSFYVDAAISAEQPPKFVIQTLSGDAEEMKPLMLKGSYADTASMSFVGTNIAISADDTIYQGRSFLDQLVGNPPAEIKRLQEKHRTFMRGKDPSIELFFENNQFLAYGNVDVGLVRSRNFKFSISVLTKEEGTVNSFKMEVPDGENLDYIAVEDVQMIGDKLYLITQNTLRNSDNFFEEKHIYTIDVATQKLIDHETIIQIPQSQERTYTDVQLVRTTPTEANEHLIILKTETKINEDMESTGEEVVSQEAFSYNIATKEKEQITLPDLHLDRNRLSFFDGSILYFMMLDGHSLIVTPYRFADNHLGQSFTINLPSDDVDGLASLTTVKDGKLYVTTPQVNSDINGDIIVADAYTGETLFKGQVVLDDSMKENDHFELYMHEMFVN